LIVRACLSQGDGQLFLVIPLGDWLPCAASLPYGALASLPRLQSDREVVKWSGHPIQPPALDYLEAQLDDVGESGRVIPIRSFGTAAPYDSDHKAAVV